MAEKVKKNSTKKKQVNSNKRKVTKKADSKKTVTKKPVSHKVKSTSPKVAEAKVISKPKEQVKQEKWYVWLKNNIIENEAKLSKKDKNRRLVVSLFAVFCFLVVVISTLIIDFSQARKNNEVPYFTIQKRDEYKQITVYYGLFYKAWKCDNGNTNLVYGKLSDKTNYCKIVPEYDKNGVFTNPNKVRMTKSQVNIIRTYYFDDYIYFESQEELEDAYKLSSAINRVLWVNGEQNEIINNDESVVLAIFGKEELVDGALDFSLQFDDTYYHKCVKKLNGEHLVSSYNYSDNTCGTSWEKLTLSKDVCKIAENSTDFIKKLAPVIDYCEEE